MADTLKQVTIHKKYMVWGGIGPILGGKVALTRVNHYQRQLIYCCTYMYNTVSTNLVTV